MELVKLLADLSQTAPLAASMANRKDSVQFAMCTTSEGDPEDLRRVRTTTPDKAALVSHDWAMRTLPCPYWDPPMPKNGMSAALSYLDGNPHDPCYAGVFVNDPNPPFEKADRINDDWREIPGAQTLRIGKTVDESSGEAWSMTIQAGDFTVTTSTDSIVLQSPQASVRISGDGVVAITAAQSVVVTSTLSAVELNSPSGLTLNGVLITADGGRISINGSEVAVIGGRDSDGDIIVDSGQ